MSKKIILLIDDEENFCKLVRKNIERTGEYEVHMATNGKDGLKLVKELKPDLILLDVMMPEMDGPDVVSAIRQDQCIEDTPVVFLTAMVKEEEAVSKSNLDREYVFLSKTATVTELMKCIKDNIRSYTNP